MSRSDRVATTDDRLEAVIEQLSGKSAWTGRAMAGEKPRSKYHREIKPGVWVDVYSVLTAWNVTNPADAHAIKKLLMPGGRGAKDGTQDRREAIQSIERAIEIESERTA